VVAAVAVAAVMLGVPANLILSKAGTVLAAPGEEEAVVAAAGVVTTAG
jgi:hypothetical protein